LQELFDETFIELDLFFVELSMPPSPFILLLFLLTLLEKDENSQQPPTTPKTTKPQPNKTNQPNQSNQPNQTKPNQTKTKNKKPSFCANSGYSKSNLFLFAWLVSAFVGFANASAC